MSATSPTDAFTQAFLEANGVKNSNISRSGYLTKKQRQYEKAMNEVLKIWQTRLKEYHEKYIASTRPNLSSAKAMEHVEHTRKRIVAGASDLTKDSTVIIFGPQVFGKKEEPLEPIQELAGRCKQVILVDFDAPTLKLIKSKVKADNVSTQLVDLSGGAYTEILKIGVAALKQPTEKRDDWFVEKYIEWMKSYPFIERISELVDKILPNGVQADYVISSLVASEIGAIGKLEGPYITKEIFKKDPFVVNGKYRKDLVSEITRHEQMFIKTHLDLLFKLTKPTGKIYYADTTKIEIDYKNPAYNRWNVFDSIVPMLDNQFKREKQSWKWDQGTRVYRVDSWMLSKIPDHFFFVFPREKTAAAPNTSSKATIELMDESFDAKSASVTTAAPASAIPVTNKEPQKIENVSNQSSLMGRIYKYVLSFCREKAKQKENA